MLEHVLKELGVTLGRHALEGGAGEVAIVVAHEDGHAAGDGGVNLVGGLTPLLHGVVEEDVLEDVVGYLGELGIVLLAELHDGDLLVLTEGGHELLVEALALLVAKGELQGLVVEGNGHEGAVDVGKHLVLVVGPLGKAGEELVHALVHGVVDVRAILVDQDAGLVLVVVGVAGDVVTALEDGDLHAAGLGEAARADGAGVARAHDDCVEGLGGKVSRQTALDAHVVPLKETMGLRAPGARARADEVNPAPVP